MNVVLIVPTGIGAEIGGHAGDANPVAKLIGKCCDKLITHPNVVNASDINEMPNNTLYVEGSILDRFLRGEIYLKEIYLNKILLAVNKPILNETINSVNAARITIGADIEVIELDTPLTLRGYYKNGKADGDVIGWEDLIAQVNQHDYDALAIQSKITINEQVALNYFKNGGVNPWGGVEAKLSKLIANSIDKPVAHSPQGDTLSDFNEVVDPRLSAEIVSVSYLHCVLKGLHKAPRINYESGLSYRGIDFLISPINCVGEPHFACMKNGIKIIAVKENKTVLNDTMPDDFIIVDNYIEAAGLLMAYQSGIDHRSVRRPFK
uniref:DUF3326 domain-containing protein n=1 Tax=viral metagenome TaxID=1070528 RepID=A0A6H1Z8R3_9ZZZZ